jgi:cardiolipin synthase
VLTLPNALTSLRILLAPVFLVLYIRGEMVSALAVFAAAAATDILDGLMARALQQKSRLGAFLDPIADKLLAMCALFALAARGRLPLWLPILEVSRDSMQLVGAAILRSTRRHISMAPTRIGKYATFTMAVTVLIVLVADFGAYTHPDAAPYVAAAGLLAALCMVVSWVQYALLFAKSVRARTV